MTSNTNSFVSPNDHFWGSDSPVLIPYSPVSLLPADPSQIGLALFVLLLSPSLFQGGAHPSTSLKP